MQHALTPETDKTTLLLQLLNQKESRKAKWWSYFAGNVEVRAVKQFKCYNIVKEAMLLLKRKTVAKKNVQVESLNPIQSYVNVYQVTNMLY